ncbi:phosphoribosyl-ATP diphosphatase [Acidisphaera sp. L21]|uniref:phosphoribosyl-ATP diphosphatase n=1 Tax=Acidisphaera sp. L21 TaxID=1641851 RepID=UPI00131BFD22|nr:phosphoribosyl-ATP diphosphatase [Acidisphaera sp. L21]
MPKTAKKKLASPNAQRKKDSRAASKNGAGMIAAEIKVDPTAQRRRADSPKTRPLDQAMNLHAESNVLDRLWSIIKDHRTADPLISHSARLLDKGTHYVAQKFGEEAVECLIEAVAGNRPGLIGESADLLYHLLVMWVDAGIRPEEVWATLENRETASNLTDRPKGPLKRLIKSVQLGTSKIP